MPALTINLRRNKDKEENPLYFDFSENRFLGAFAIDSLVPHSFRRRLGRIFNFLILLAIVPYIYAGIMGLINIPASRFLGTEISLYPAVFAGFQGFWTGILFIAVSFRLLIYAIEGFYNSKILDKKGDTRSKNFCRLLNFYAAELWYKSSPFLRQPSLSDLVSGMSKTQVGRIALLRLGIFPQEFEKAIKPNEKFADSLTELLAYFEGETLEAGNISLAGLVAAFFDLHGSFNKFMVERGFTRDMVLGAAEWVENDFKAEDLYRRWWSRERLGRIPAFGRGWAYGRTPLLERFTSDFDLEARSSIIKVIGKNREIELLELALLKQSGANVIIVGEPGSGKETLLLGLAREIYEGSVFPELEHKQIFKLHGAAIAAAGKEKGETEELMIRILNESVRAGNVILAIDEFPEFIESLSKLGVSAVEIFSPYLSSTDIHIIALGDTLNFRRVIENNAGLMKYFEKIDIEEPNEKNLTRILGDLAPRLEAQNGGKTIVTYPAILKIGETAINNLVTGALPERAVDLMEQVVQEASSSGKTFLLPEDVLKFVSEKTKMPLGVIKEEEQEKLLNLEKLLHKRVIGQNEAILAVADAVKRARSGVRNPKRPISSFLFLGPTGVGKTETAKALAEVYFGNEDYMLRFDMTEYQTNDDIKRLIGSRETNDPGILSSKIRANPYTVVLLDEFEKSSYEIRNLFLQVLDEGFFSDFLGQRVNMRNTLIVATSNAGSQLIWNFIREKKDPTLLRDEIIAHIQKERIMSPELLNRFDSVIVFHPLDEEALRKIARLMLKKLIARLKKQNLELEITEDLIEFAVKGGYDPTFGARPMQRFIQDKVEKIISEKIIKGEVKPGAKFEISRDELKS